MLTRTSDNLVIGQKNPKKVFNELDLRSWYSSGLRGDRHRGEHLRVLARGTSSILWRGCAIAGLSFLTPKNEGPTWGPMCQNSGSAQCHPVAYGCFSLFRCFTVLALYVWYGYVAFTGRIGVGNHLSSFRNWKVLALEDGRETSCLRLILGLLTAA